MRKEKYWKQAVVLGLIAVGGLCFSQTVQAEGTEEPDGPSTKVWIDVIEKPRQDRISVTVPMAYGFVVVGSTNLEDTTPISVEQGNLLLPNYRVEKTTEEDGGDSYSLSVNLQELVVKNFSTTIAEDSEEREGLPVKLEAYMDGKDDQGVFTKPGSWTLTDSEPQAMKEDYKKYRMVLDRMPFSKKTGEAEDQRYYMDGEISLTAPPDLKENGWTSAGTANVPSEHRIEVDVNVGGVQGNYNQVEESVKAGRIHWIITPDLGTGQ